ncbi:hypothetical protein QQF64_025518 [Cirrhinus molitorella]|uniref:Ig-like domain-containing protein n=1 Tax=Cirrhinus molitorella TaxID=172907 RepID=A0ABR3NQP8_9TELE
MSGAQHQRLMKWKVCLYLIMSVSASVGEDVTLNCSVDSHITPEHIEEVSWKKTDKDGNILVLLYQNNETLLDSADKRYIDRAEFFTAEIPKGNFSLRLKSVRTEDKGVYMCQVFAGGLSANATVVLERPGFSVSHIMVLILCISASGSALLLCCLIYHRSCDKGFLVQHCHNQIFLGSSVVLPCYIDKCLLNRSLEVEWRRTDSDTLIHLYQDGESRLQQDYHDRAHFFTDQIQHGNFSLRLDNLTAEDEGQYTCRVYSDQDCVYSSETNLILTFTVEESDSLVVPLGSSVVLPCQINKRLLKKRLEVEWRRTDTDTLIHLYQDGAEAQTHYHDRAHFLTDQIQHGNFSLCLDNLRAEDKGRYTCKVYSEKDCVYSAITDLELWFEVTNSCQMLVPLGSSVVLPCYGDKHLKEKSLKVEWRRPDSETLVHLYQDDESQAEKLQQDYHDRAHFFTDQIQHGNFSLCLDNLTAEDEGRYICTVYRNQTSEFSSEANLELRLQDTVFRLEMFLIFCPNMTMFLSFVLWGVSEGSLNESVSCCALYFLRPLMLLWAAPYAHEFTGKTKKFIHECSYDTEYIVLSTVFYSVLFKSAWDKSLNYTGFEGVTIIVLFVIVLLLNLIYIVLLLAKFIWTLSKQIITIFRVLARISFDILPSLQFLLMFFAFGSARSGFITVAVLPVFLTLTRYDWDLTCGKNMHCSLLFMRLVWLILMLLVNAIMVYFYIIALRTEKDRIGWACMIAFLQLLWALINFTWSFKWDLHRVVPVYVFGSVGVVLLNSVTLMTELILKTVNGNGAVGDLRVVVFSSEILFTLFLMIILVFEPWIKMFLQLCQKEIRSCRTPAAGSENQDFRNAAGSDGSKRNTTESHEMNPLLNTVDQKADRTEDRLIVHGPSGPLVAPLGSSVVLPCYVDELLLMEGLEVEWKRTDSETLVHLYQDGKSQAEKQQQDYHDRAHFFTDQIQRGNFSLHLDNLTAEDEGRYTCKVYSQQASGETVVEIKVHNVEHLLVSGSSHSISASVGEDVTLNCSVDSHITPEHTEEVSWKKTDEVKDILVLLYQNNETLSDSSDERYIDRAEFFTAEIPKGNFSLRLKNVRIEDKGVYMCQVFAGGLSANSTVVLEQLGES